MNKSQQLVKTGPRGYQRPASQRRRRLLRRAKQWFSGEKIVIWRKQAKNNRRSSQVNKKEKRFSSNICQLWQVPNQRQSWWFDALSVVQRGTRGDLLAFFVWLWDGKSWSFFGFMFVCFSFGLDQSGARCNLPSLLVEKCLCFLFTIPFNISWS